MFGRSLSVAITVLAYYITNANARLRKQSSIHKSTNQTQVIWQSIESSNVLEEIGNNGLPSEVFPLSHCKGDCDNDDECEHGLICMQRYSDEIVEGCIGTIRDSIDVCILEASTTSTQSRDDEIHPTYAPSIWPSYSPTLEKKQATVQNYTGSLVSKDPDTGRLIYAKYKNQGQENAVNTVPDYSSAGYKGGGVPIPFISSKVVIRPSDSADDWENIQSAIDKVSALPIDSNGFRGAVLIKAGDYTVSKTLRIITSGVVIRGEGSNDLNGTRILYSATQKSNLFEVGYRHQDDEDILWRDAAYPFPVRYTSQRIADSYVPVGAKSFTVSQGNRYRKGDRIVVLNDMNDKWLHDMSRMKRWGWTSSYYKLIHRRVVTAVVGNTIYINAPIVQTIEAQYGGGIVYKYYTLSEPIRNIGFEGLRLKSSYLSEYDERHGWTGIVYSGIEDSWVRQVTGENFGYGLFSAESWTKQVTVEDSAMLDHKSQIRGGRRYSFNLDRAEFILLQRLLTREGRHDFVSHSRTPGPNVFLDSIATNTYSDIGPHHRYATGQLYDNISGDNINVRNRYNSGTGHGWAGAQIMFWNVEADVICDAPHGAQNYAVGVNGMKNQMPTSHEPYGIWESHNQTVDPRSLYQAQLTDRMGKNALHRIVLPQQRSGRIWNELVQWNGDGLFLDPILTWHDEEAIPIANTKISIGAYIRDLRILEEGFSSLWTETSNQAVIEDNSSLHTSVSFPSSGLFKLRLSITSGSGFTTHSDHVIEVAELV